MLTRIELSPALQRARTASGLDPFVLILILPLVVCFRISSIESRIVSHINSGSPSHPCPKLMIGKGAVERCGTANSTISSGDGLNCNRSWVDTMGSSSGCREIQPIQLALQAGDTGTGHSHLPNEKLRAAGQLYVWQQFSIKCLTKRLWG